MLYISNFMLDLFNFILTSFLPALAGWERKGVRIMKKVFLPVLILTFVLIITGIRIFHSGITEKSEFLTAFEFIYVAFILIFFFIGNFFWIKRIKSAKSGLPEEDELSKRISQKASSVSFYISLFLWLVLLFILQSKIIQPEILFGFGFIGMAVTFIITWLIFNSRGIGNE